MIEHLSDLSNEMLDTFGAFLRATLRHEIAGLAEACGWSEQQAAVLADYAASDPDVASAVVDMLKS